MNDSNVINIVFAVNNVYVKFLSVTLISLIKNTDKYIRCFILENEHELDKTNKEKLEALKKIKDFAIEYIKIDTQNFSYFKRAAKHISMETNFRLLIASLLPESVEKCIYLDSDLIVIDDIDKLWSQDIRNDYIGAVLTPPVGFNAGVLLINVKKWREDSIEQQFFAYAEQNMDKLRSVDQELINHVCGSKIKLLSLSFNYNPKFPDEINDQLEDPVIVHWAGTQKPWINRELFGSVEFWNYAKESPFYDEIKDPKIYLLKKNIILSLKFIGYCLLNFITLNKVTILKKEFYKYRLIMSLPE